MPTRNETKVKHAHLSTLWPPNRKHEEGGGVGIPLHSEIGKGGSVALDRLTDLAFHRIQLHGSHNTVLLHNKRRQSELLIPQHGFAAQQRKTKWTTYPTTRFCCTTKTKWTTSASGACTQQTKMCQSNRHHLPMNSLSSNPSDVLSYTNNIHLQVSEQTHTAKGFRRSL